MKRLSPTTIAAVALSTVLLGVAAADFANTESRVAPIPADSCGTDDACNDARIAKFDRRLEAANELEQQYRSRAWLYSCAFIAVIAVATAVALKSRRRKDWPRVFTNLGIAGVWAGIGATAILLLTSGGLVEVPSGPAYAPAAGMVAAALVGTLVGRDQGWSQVDSLAEARAGAFAFGWRTLGGVERGPLGGFASGPRREAAARWFTFVALALTGLTVLMAMVFIQPQPNCGGEIEDAPAWADTVGAIGAIAGIGAMAAGVGALLLRRWLPSLISLVINPFALLFMVASTCAFY